MLNGESCAIVSWNIKSVLFKMDSVPLALVVMVLLTVTESYLGIFFHRSQVLYRGKCNSLHTKPITFVMWC